MRKSILVMVSLALMGITGLSQTSQKDFPKLKGPYLGQKAPGQQPELFADGIIANSYPSFHSSVMFTPDGRECYWQANLGNDRRVILCSKMEDGVWTFPAEAWFSKLEHHDDCPFISPDGKRFFFISRRPINENDAGGKERIWIMEMTDGGWGEPRPLPPCINSLPGIHWQLSVDLQGNLYFSTYEMEARGRSGDIHYSECNGGGYSEPVKLGGVINSPDYEFSPFVSPDGSYLLFSRETYGSGECRLFISFKDREGEWANPQDLSFKLGTGGICPVVSYDRKYLFFLDYVKSFSQPFWISAGIIQELETEVLN